MDHGPHISQTQSETEAWTHEHIERADIRDLQTARDFETEFLQALDLRKTDDLLDKCLLSAFQAYIEGAESGRCSPEGSFLLALRALVRNHRAFEPYAPGPPELWPRPSNVVQAEIDSRMPDALACLRDELEMALAEEGQSNCSDGACDL